MHNLFEYDSIFSSILSTIFPSYFVSLNSFLFAILILKFGYPSCGYKNGYLSNSFSIYAGWFNSGLNSVDKTLSLFKTTGCIIDELYI